MALKILLFITMMLAFVCAENAVALSVDTHRQINEHIAEKTFNGFSLNTVLVNKLGLSNANEQKFNGRTVKLILGDGGEYEDLTPGYFPYIRSFNHFLDPVNNAGLFWPFDSAATWATRQPAQQYAGYYAWADTRSNFYLALTSESKTDRDIKFGETFRGLGQLMHLVSDMSVPEHARLDMHVQPVDYEHYVERNIADLLAKINSPAPNPYEPVFFNGRLTDSITLLFDSNQYDGANPGVTKNGDIGLAEFTNANFLSDDTIFSSFTYPSRASVQKTRPDARNRQYIEKTGDGVPVKHLAAISALYQYRELYFPQFSESLPLGLDDVVYEDYAALLIPRAVGYSADMLKYFFRGEIGLVQDGGGNIIINNRTATQEAMNGRFSIYYDTDTGMRKQLYEDQTDRSVVYGVPSYVNFVIPSITDAAVTGRYILVFNGTLGDEKNAVAAQVSDLVSKRWEDWESGTGNFTDPAYNTYNFAPVQIKTPKRTWSGIIRNSAAVKPAVDVAGGMLKFDGRRDAYATSGSALYINTWLEAKDYIDAGKCLIRLKAPPAKFYGPSTQEWGSVEAAVYLTDGMHSFRLRYAVAEGDYLKSLHGARDLYRKVVGPGEYSSNIAGDLQAYINAWEAAYPDGYYTNKNLGDANKYKVTNVAVSFDLTEYQDAGFDYSNRLEAAFDYIDFECKQ